MATATKPNFSEFHEGEKILRSVQERYLDNPEKIENMYKAAQSGNREQFMNLLRQVVSRARYIGEWGHNLSAKAPE